MPITIKLSRRFYETLGEDVANEFVDALNNVDAAYRSELRDTMEQHFSRFDAKLEQRLTTLRTDLDSKWMERWTTLDMKWTERWTDLGAKLERQKSELVRWMFGFWATTLLGLGALYLRR